MLIKAGNVKDDQLMELSLETKPKTIKVSCTQHILAQASTEICATDH
jgi:hypothetical protein